MKTHGTDRFMPTTQQLTQLGILLGFVISIVTEIVTRFFFALNSDEAKALLQSKGVLSRKISDAFSEVFVATADEYTVQRTYWEGIYSTHYGIDADFSQVVVPKKPCDGKWRLVFMPKGLIINQAAVAYQKVISDHDPKWELKQAVDDLDAAVTHNIRTQIADYAFWVCDEQEADKKLYAQATKQAIPHQSLGITVRERLVCGAVHFIETKRHLDEQNSTLCFGSRYSDGSIPYIYCNRDDYSVSVCWGDAEKSCHDAGVRQVVVSPRTT